MDLLYTVVFLHKIIHDREVGISNQRYTCLSTSSYCDILFPIISTEGVWYLRVTAIRYSQQNTLDRIGPIAGRILMAGRHDVKLQHRECPFQQTPGVSFTKLCNASYDQLTHCRSHKLIFLQTVAQLCLASHRVTLCVTS